MFVLPFSGITDPLITPSLTDVCSTYMQYYVIGLTNFQAGIDTVTSYAALVLAVWLFQVRVLAFARTPWVVAAPSPAYKRMSLSVVQRYLIRRNWRATHYASRWGGVGAACSLGRLSSC